MVTITVVCTMHNDLGQCNADELLRILEILRPEVIFEEIRPSDLEARYGDESLHSLEMRAITKYLEGRSVTQVPVDDYIIPDDFGEAHLSLFKYAGTHSREYRELMQVEEEEISNFGFPYLNSQEWEALNKRVRELFEEVISQSGDDLLMQRLATWNDLIRKREVSMVEKIHAYARKNRFTKGVFIVGAAHKSAIVELINKHQQTGMAHIDWRIGISN